MKWIPLKKLKVLTILFLGTGTWGIIAGMVLIKPIPLILVLFGVINLCIGGFIGYRYFMQGPKPERSSNKRKK
ncbi:MAG: hypothetical protein FJ354_03555 [Thaumarchaeota archaeon]|nr:hypothetical protein [Nitrososphaerota archaeon]